MADMTFEESQKMLRERFSDLGPWVSRYVVNGISNGGWFDVLTDVRVAKWIATLDRKESILECGSLEGGHTALLARSPGGRHVLGLEYREANLAKCRFAHEVMNLKNTEFRQCDLDTEDLEQFGQFDAVWCSGVLYHLMRPVQFFRKITANSVFLGTHYSLEAEDEFEGQRGRWYTEQGYADVLSGASPQSFWLTLGNICEMASDCGFTIYDMKTSEAPNGPWVDVMMKRKA